MRSDGRQKLPLDVDFPIISKVITFIVVTFISGQRSKFFLWMLLWMLCGGGSLCMAQEEVSVKIFVDQNEVKKEDTVVLSNGDTFTFSIVINSSSHVNINKPRWPHLDQFELHSTGTSTQIQSSVGWGTGETNRIQTFNYTLIATQEGQHKIGPITVMVSGKAYNTPPLAFNVLPANQNPQAPSGGQAGGGEPPQKKPSHPSGQPKTPLTQMEEMFSNLFNKNHPRWQMPSDKTPPPDDPNTPLFVRVKVDKSKAYVGEQITVAWYLYTRGHVREIDTLMHPSNKGFWKEDITIATRLNFTNEVVDGVAYRKALLASYALFPLKEGPTRIDPYKVKCILIEGTTYGFGRPVQYIKESNPIHIEVMPLPTENRPPDFSGAVGNFQVRSQLDGSSVPVNQPVTWRVRFSGQGNAKLIDLPELKLPPSLEVYNTKKESKFFRNGQSYKEFEILLIPRSQGEFRVPALSVSAFDPQTGAYYQQHTEEHHLVVKPAEGESIISASPLENKEEKPQLPEVMTVWKSQGLWGTKQKVAFWILVYLFVFGFLGWRFVVEFGLTQKKKDLRKLVHLKIQSVGRVVEKEDWREVGISVTNLVYRTLGEISGLGGASVELEKLILKLPPSVRRELGDPIRRQNKFFEVLSFAPDEMLSRFKNKEDIIKQVLAVEQTLLKAIDLGLGEPEKDKKTSRRPLDESVSL